MHNIIKDRLFEEIACQCVISSLLEVIDLSTWFDSTSTTDVVEELFFGRKVWHVTSQEPNPAGDLTTLNRSFTQHQKVHWRGHRWIAQVRKERLTDSLTGLLLITTKSPKSYTVRFAAVSQFLPKLCGRHSVNSLFHILQLLPFGFTQWNKRVLH